MSLKHLNLYARKFANKHNFWDIDVVDLIGAVVVGMDERQLPYLDLTADKVLISGARV